MASSISYYAIHDSEGRIQSFFAVSSDNAFAIRQPPPGYLVSQVNADDFKGIGDDPEKLRELIKNSRIDLPKPVRLIKDKR